MTRILTLAALAIGTWRATGPPPNPMVIAMRRIARAGNEGAEAFRLLSVAIEYQAR